MLVVCFMEEKLNVNVRMSYFLRISFFLVALGWFREYLHIACLCLNLIVKD